MGEYYKIGSDPSVSPVLGWSILYAAEELKNRMNDALRRGIECERLPFDAYYAYATFLCQESRYDTIRYWAEENIPKAFVSRPMWKMGGHGRILSLTHLQIYLNNPEEVAILKKEWIP